MAGLKFNINLPPFCFQGQLMSIKKTTKKPDVNQKNNQKETKKILSNFFHYFTISTISIFFFVNFRPKPNILIFFVFKLY